jgi:hypothetical protein
VFKRAFLRRVANDFDRDHDDDDGDDDDDDVFSV